MNELDKYLKKHLGQLVGKTITGVVKDKDVWGVKFGDGTVAWILCDEEGNGPGHLQIQSGK